MPTDTIAAKVPKKGFRIISSRLPRWGHMAAFRKATTYWFWGARLLGNRLKANTLTHAKNTANRSGLRPRTSRSVSRPGEQALAHLCGVTLNRHRGKGQQKVTVEHVHMHAGGQAVVGTVETPGEGIGSHC